VNPDEFYVFKTTLKENPKFRPIIQRRLGNKEFKLVYDTGGTRMTKNVPVPPEERERFCISDEDLLTLSRWACRIEEHYSQKRGSFCPMDMEWAKDGITGQLYIVQARPETVQSQKAVDSLETYQLKEKSRVLVQGRAVGERIASGVVRMIKSPAGLKEFQEGEILVTDKTDPDWEPTMKKAAAIVTNRGGRTCHAAIVSRELGVPAIVGTETATDSLKNGQLVTVSCAEGDTGFVYEGQLDFVHESVPLKDMARPRTKIMMNLANPDEAFRLSLIPNDGVGLAREEFIVTHFIKVHPLALLEYEKLDESLRAEIDAITIGYEDKVEFFVERLAEGVAMIAAAFYPRDVILRLSDFKTNEYANLVGGEKYEPREENPMIGFRGASRYYDDRYRDGFALECRAIQRVRETMGLRNLKVMIPFCRTVEEGRKVIQEMEKHNLKQGDNGLEIYVMCEIPSNVILAEEFAQV
ncbi:MAG: phosphoenolpyruvate synthase, partial [Planctomycetaceae bacterium]|nr:phosphoenolpyruvate synthase [Planctomycetaceae bacterium]